MDMSRTIRFALSIIRCTHDDPVSFFRQLRDSSGEHVRHVFPLVYFSLVDLGSASAPEVDVAETELNRPPSATSSLQLHDHIRTLVASSRASRSRAHRSTSRLAWLHGLHSPDRFPGL